MPGRVLGGALLVSSDRTQYICEGGMWLTDVAVNGMVWYRPTKAELDKLESLGNPGWNWENLLPVSA